MERSDIWELSGGEQADLIRRRQISSEEICETVVARISALDPVLQTFHQVNPRWRDEARAADKRTISSRRSGPLHGVPISVKDLLMTSGIRTTFGSRIYADYVPEEDEVPVARLRAAGAVIIGKTVTPEFGFAQSPDSYHAAPRNPWDLRRAAGSSSGGSAAAVCAGLGAVSLGSDGGGSLRAPAAMCGVFTIKPTFGVVPVYPTCRTPSLPGVGAFESLECIGPIARTVDDAIAVMKVISGFSTSDWHSSPARPRKHRLGGGLKVGWLTSWGGVDATPEIATVVEDAAVSLADAIGARAVSVRIDMDDNRAAFRALVASEANLRQLRELTDGAGSRLSLSVRQIAETAWTAEQFTDAHAARQVVRALMTRTMSHVDLIVTPVVPAPPYLFGESAPSDWTAFLFPANMTGQPAVSLPVGFLSSGLPASVQVIGRRMEDNLVLEACRRFQLERDWARVWPSSVTSRVAHCTVDTTGEQLKK